MKRFRGLSEAQSGVFEEVVWGNDGGHHPRTLESLVRLSLIERSEEVLPGHLPILIWRYHVPIWAHMEWCQWCAENVPLEDVIPEKRR